ncbi:MAG: hypothetical protein OHK93_004802 [Ramalina farinacea]|uniref:Uncharacterized protein n=1 Tax=Ramalina farinacea TaxID=258253 RepID=A0AA43QUU6_9LECA|nr:hypothetical protein [Ramalina farinacea]
MGRGFLANLHGFPGVDRPAPEPEVFHRFRLSLRTDILTFIMVGCAHMEPYCPGMAFLTKDQKDRTDREKSFTRDMDELADTLNFKESLVQLSPLEMIDIYHYLLDNPLDTGAIAERWAEICSFFNAGEADKSVNNVLVYQEATYEEHQEMLVQQHATFIDLRLGHGAARPYDKCLRSYFKEVGSFHGTLLHEPHAGKCVMDDMDLIKKSMRATPEDYRQAEEDGLLDSEQSEDSWPSRASSLRQEDDERIKEEALIGNGKFKGRSLRRASSVRSEDHQRAEEGSNGNERVMGPSRSRASTVRAENHQRANDEGLIGHERYKDCSPSGASSVRSGNHQQAKDEELPGCERYLDHPTSRESSVQPEDHQRANDDGLTDYERYLALSLSQATSMRSNRTGRTDSIHTKVSRQASSTTQKPRNSRLFSDLLRGADEVTNLTRSFSMTTPRPHAKGKRHSRTEDKTKLITSSERGRRLTPDSRSTTGKDTPDPGPSSYREDSSNIPEYYLRSLSLRDGRPDMLGETSRASSDRGATISSDDTLHSRGGRGRRQLTPTSDDEESSGKQQRYCARR